MTPTGQRPVQVALLGAGRTGKTTLSHALATALRGEGFSVAVRQDLLQGECAIGTQVVIVDAASAQAAAATVGSCDLALVMGLDLPALARGSEADDASLREALTRAGIAYRVVYGTGERRTRSALEPVLQRLGRGATGDPDAARWTWSCDSCSDPDCEHRLFRGLFEKRSPTTD